MNRDNLKVEDIDDLSDEFIIEHSSEDELLRANREAEIVREFPVALNDSENLESSQDIINKLSQHLHNIRDSKDEFILMSTSPMENCIEVTRISYNLKMNLLRDMWKESRANNEIYLKM